MRACTSLPRTKASSNSGPLTVRSSASASSAGATGAVGWITVAQMRVAEVMHVGAGGVEERRAQRVDALGAARSRWPACRRRTRLQRLQRDLDRVGAATRQRDREEIHEGALGLMPHVRRHILPPRGGDIVRKALRDIDLLQHCSSRFPPSIRRVAIKFNRLWQWTARAFLHYGAANRQTRDQPGRIRETK